LVFAQNNLFDGGKRIITRAFKNRTRKKVKRETRNGKGKRWKNEKQEKKEGRCKQTQTKEVVDFLFTIPYNFVKIFEIINAVLLQRQW
jgi:hypothetical protein